MNISVDSILAASSAGATGQADASGAQSSAFTDYLSQAILSDAAGAAAVTDAGDAASSAALQSLLPYMLTGDLGESSDDVLSVILMYLLTERDDAMLPQVLDAYTSGDAGTAQTAARAIPGFAENDEIVRSALTRLGDPYSQAKAGDGDYTDCSYLTRWCYRAAGAELPRTAAAQAKYLEDRDLTVTKDELKPGDLIFYSFKQNGRYKNISHVGIYAGNGKMIDASSVNGRVVHRDMFEGAILYARPEV